MGSITTGIGLISGIDTASLIDSLIALESAGKFRLQNRIGTIQAQQTALLDINARLLNLKNASGAFRLENIFSAVQTTSSDEEALIATAGTNAQPGSFTFIVKQLVSTSQQLTRGFATANATPLGLDSISFEYGNGNLSTDRALEDLNGGLGVDRGRISIQDRAGETATIDLTDVTSLDEVVQRINDNEDVEVTASIDDDHLVITDDTGVTTSSLTVSNLGSSTTAADLGIAGTAAADVLTGTGVFYLGGTTSLKSLNDGNGVLVRNNTADLRITARDGSVFDVDFGRVDLDIDDSTLLEDLNDGAGVRIDNDGDTADIKLTDRDGNEYEIDLTGVTTVGGLRGRIATATGGNVTLEVTDGDHFKVVDSSGGSGNLKIEGTDDNGTDLAEDLGILNEVGVAADEYEGTVIPSSIDEAAATTLQEIVDRINGALDATLVANGGRIVASIGATGLVIDDTTGGGGNLIIESTATNPDAASDLGIENGPVGVAAGTVNGRRLIAGLDSVLVRSLNGGNGLNGETDITVSDREGNTYTVTDLDLYETGSLEELIDHLNSEFQGNGVNVTFGLNATGNGLSVTDTSAAPTGNLTISDAGATALGIDADVAEATVNGRNAQLQYVSNAAQLDDLNYGRGIGKGSFRITDGLGATAVVDIGGTEETLHDIIQEINSKGLAITARVNDNGDGLIIEEDPTALGGQTPFVKIKVESTGGTTASDLNILGESDDVVGGFIDGSYERVVDLATSDTLNEVAAKINAEDIPLSAAVVNTGAGATPYRLSFSSGISGRAGDLTVDTGGVDLGLTATSEGRDAKVFFGSDNPEDALLITSATNTLDGVLNDVSIDLLTASDDPVTITIARDETAIVDAVQRLATTFNDAIDRLKAYDFFDTETEERGVLLGDPTVARIRGSLYRIATGKALNVEGSFQYLSQVGITFNGQGQMAVDATKLQEAYDADPEGVENLFAAYDANSPVTEEIAPGVTVTSSDTTFSSLGFGSLFDNLLDDLTNSIDGTTKLADDNFENQITLLTERIETIDVRLDARRERLTLEFTAMETALAQLQNQSAALSSLSSNLLLSSSRSSG